MSTVIHLIPYLAIGGVERAAQSMIGSVHDRFSFSVMTMIPPGAVISRFTLWNPLVYFTALHTLLRVRPNVLIVSLWRSYAVGVMVKLLRPRTRLVVFLHFPLHVHLLDAFLTRLAAFLATQVWADSQQTLEQRLPRLHPLKVRVISFVTERIAPVTFGSLVRPSFIFWGRIHPQKGLSRAVRIFAGVIARRPDARFVIIGPDGGDLEAVKQQVVEMDLNQAVFFRGSLDFSDICQESVAANFYLQTSELEGMAMSVVEAMQLGLVPIVTPVGEIAHYARKNENALLVVDDSQAVSEVLELLRDSPRYSFLRANAIARWEHQPLYKDDVSQACSEILGLF
jgi:glycosyltransferase involved in cell wall biosynthesis